MNEQQTTVDSARVQTAVLDNPDGTQTLVMVFPTGLVHVAYRNKKWQTWSAPVRATLQGE